MAWLILPSLAILAIAGWLSYTSAVRQATLVMDRQLVASARIIAEAIDFSEGQLAVAIPPSALELFATDSHDEVAYEVIGPTGELIAGYPGLPMPLDASIEGTPSFFEAMFRDESMRVTLMRQPVVTPDETVSVTVAVGETLKARDELVQALWLRSFFEEAALVIGGGLCIWIGISRQLRPLLQLRQEVMDRPTDNFEPFHANAVQTEIRPLVAALNSHMDRLRAQLDRQRRFLDNAAHQLRTPLAVMKTQVGYARRTQETTQVDLALREVDGNLSSMARLTSQLLTLGGVEHERRAEQDEVLDFDEAVRATVSDGARRALDQGIELGFEGEGVAWIRGTRLLVGEMVANLVDNVVLHAGAGAHAMFSVRRSVRDVVLRVEDDGQGIDAADRQGLLERFHRGRNARPGGSGLGLAIVAEIAEALGGAVELPAPRGGRGFCVLVRLPAAQEPVTTS